MRQQINLYQPIFRKQKIIFSARTILWLSIGFLILLLAWSQLIGQRISGLESEYERQQAAEQRAVEQLVSLQRSLPPSTPDPDLETRIQGLEEQRDNLHLTLEALESRRPVAEADIGPRLDALARQVPHGLWLTGLELEANNGAVLLEGRALSARLVPEYLDALTGSPLMGGTAFRTVRVTTSEDDRPGVRFVLSTTAEEQR